MRKVTSKSFTQKHQLPTNLPPLLKKQSNQDPQKQMYPPTSRPPFVIRKKNASFLQSSTARKQPTGYQDQRKMMNETGSQLNKQNNGKNMQQQTAKTNLRNSEDGRKTTQPRARQALSSNMENDQDVSLCKVQIQEFVENKSQCFRKKKYKISENNLLEKLTENMVNSKSLKKKRKIEECKTRKINWGSNKNDVFNLGISVIKLNKEENIETPVQSLKQLYIQIL